MLKLMKLELQRINLHAYFVSVLIFGAVFTYFVAYVAQVEQETQFMNYGNILRLTGAISVILFSVLSATMYSRIIIGEYSGRRLALLFSYPVSRKKIFLSKVLIVFLFVFLSMLLCTAVSIAIFTVTESAAPIVSDVMTGSMIAEVCRTTVVSLIAVNAIGLISMRIGFIRKSVPAALISSFILAGVYGNIAVGGAETPAVSLLAAGVSLIVIFVVIVTLSNKIHHMEA